MELTRPERERLADEHGEQARRLRLAGQPAEAMHHADTGVALVEGLLTERPDEPSVIWALAGQLDNRAAIQEELDQPANGIPDARRSVELYQQLITSDTRVGAYAAEAQTRLARLIALAPDGTGPGGVDEARDAVSGAVTTYLRLAGADQQHWPGLARVLYARGEVFRLLAAAASEPPSTETLDSYIDALQVYDALGEQVGDEDNLYHARALLQTARMYRHPDADLADMRGVATAAADRFWQRVNEGRGGYDDCVAALHLLGEIMRSEGAPDWTQPLRAARHLLARMVRPLSEETAERERDIDQHLDGPTP
ncbi:hypothetical protein GCM10023322_42910 [Rugosimonospora acidiphila]|uniref:Tetratricopeptide repeat protein n=1 Tax=Rugosimonospora acidiphila TaxID=556531 RepID=A0ABP9S1C1_9ACTN